MLRMQCWMVAGLTVSLIGIGCDKPGGNYKTAKEIKQEKGTAGHTDHDHDHSAGPHGGAIVELGDEEYHAEVVVDGKAHSLTVYLFGKDAKTPAPISAAEITVGTEDKKKLTLKAAPQESDGEGKSSKFELKDEAEIKPIAEAGFLHGSLQLEVDGKPYRGDIDAHFDGTSHDDHAKEGEKKEEAKATEEPAKEPEAPAEKEEAKKEETEK